MRRVSKRKKRQAATVAITEQLDEMQEELALRDAEDERYFDYQKDLDEGMFDFAWDYEEVIYGDPWQEYRDQYWDDVANGLFDDDHDALLWDKQ